MLSHHTKEVTGTGKKSQALLEGESDGALVVEFQATIDEADKPKNEVDGKQGETDQDLDYHVLKDFANSSFESGIG